MKGLMRGWNAERVVIALALVFGIGLVVFLLSQSSSQAGISLLAAILVVIIVAGVAYAIYASRHPPRERFNMRG